MPTVTALKPQKNNKRVNVYLDNEFSFGIDLDNLVILKIKVGNEYTQEQIDELIKKAQYQKTLDKLLRFASMRLRSEIEIERWLTKKEIHKSLWESLKDKLKYFELLDDFKFAKWWVDQRLIQKKSLRSIVYELRNKGIKQNIIDEVLSETKIDEGKIARDLVAKKMYKWENLEPKIKKQKITQYLAQKGFSWEVIQKMV